MYTALSLTNKKKFTICLIVAEERASKSGCPYNRLGGTFLQNLKPSLGILVLGSNWNPPSVVGGTKLTSSSTYNIKL